MFWRKRKSNDFGSEIQSHLELEIDHLKQQGLSEEDARSAARRRFGNLTRAEEQFYESQRWAWADTLGRSIRFGLRSLSRSPGFTFSAILVMALGLGGNVAIFAVIRGVLLKPLPYHDPSRLVVLYQGQQSDHEVNLPVDAGSFWQWQQAVNNSAELALINTFGQYGLSIRGGELPEMIHAGWVSWNFFHLLGVQPALGRTFNRFDDTLGASATVILVDSLWRRRFNADPAVIGSQIWLDARLYTVIGVMPSWFKYESKVGGGKTQIWLPVQQAAPASFMHTYEDHEFIVLGRLARGITATSLYKRLATVQRQIKAAHPGPAVRDSVMGYSLLDDAISGYRSPLLTIFAATGCVLLIACLNVGSLLVARTAARRKELALRTALGAGRMRLLCERLLESFLLSIGGGLVGILLAGAAISWLVHTRQDMNRVDSIHIDSIVAVFAAAAVVVCALFSGLISVWSTNSKSLLAPLQESSRGNSAGQLRTGLRRTLLAAQVGLTVVLLVCSGLLLKSYLLLRTTDLGISTDNVLTMQFNLPGIRYNMPAQKAAFMEELLRGVRALPGVEAAGLVSTAPGQGWGGDFLVSIPEHPPRANGAGLDFLVRAADPDYFAAAGIPILRGGTFASWERLDHADAVLISQSAASRFFPNEDPVGKHLRIDYSGMVFRIVGVVGDTRWTVSQPDYPTLYMPIFGNGLSSGTLLVRSTRNVEALSLPIQRFINTMDRDLPVTNVETLRETIGKSTLGSEFNSLLVLGFAVIALVLAAAGVYGVLAYLVTQRTNEIGVRIALGAQPAQILRLTLLDGLRPALLGLIIGLAGSVAVAKLIRSLLYGIEPYDSTVFLAVITILVAVAALACTIPAWRASRLDPLQALRVD